MKRNHLFLALVLALALMLTANASLALAEEAATDWTSFEGWQSEDWDSKEISYQFYGEWDLPEYNFAYRFLVNLYSDGSVAIDQRNAAASSSYWMYGCWSEETTEDGNEITLDTLYVVDLDNNLAAHEYNYTLYEESDGNYSFGLTFGIAPAQFFRDVDVAGGAEVNYASFADFDAAADAAFQGGAGDAAESAEGEAAADTAEAAEPAQAGEAAEAEAAEDAGTEEAA